MAAAAAIDLVAQQLRSNKITSISLRFAPKLMQHKGLIEALRHNNSVRELDLRHADLGPSGCRTLARLLSPNWRVLDLRGTRVGDSGISALFRSIQKLGRPSELEVLDVWECGISDDGAAKVGALLGGGSCPFLKRVNLGRNQLQCDGAVALGSGLAKASALRSLELRANYIADNGAAGLALGLQVAPLLEVLGLKLNSVGDRGAEALAAAAGQYGCALRSLNLDRNSVGEHGLAALQRAAAARIGGLQQIGLQRQLGSDVDCSYLYDSRGDSLLNVGWSSAVRAEGMSAGQHDPRVDR